MNRKDKVESRITGMDKCNPFFIDSIRNAIINKRKSGFLDDTIKAFGGKYICNIKFYDFDSYEISFMNKDIGVYRVPALVVALFPDRIKTIKRDNGVIAWCGFDCGNYIRRLDSKTVAIMNVSTDLLDQDNSKEHQRLSSGVKQRLYSIWIIGKNCIRWKKKLAIRAIKAEIKERTNPDNLQNGILSTLQAFDAYIVNTKILSDMVIDKEMHCRVINAIDNFIANRDEYIKRGIPYRLGILLYGRPGTGKSAYIRALALKYGREVFYINRSMIADDENSIGEDPFYRTLNTFYVIEEIDTLLDKREGEFSKNLGKEEITGFIDSLDNGHIIFATTNYREKIIELEESIIRPGRFSLHIEMPYFQREQADEMATKMGLDDLSFLDELKYPICPTELEFICTQRLFESVQQMKK